MTEIHRPAVFPCIHKGAAAATATADADAACAAAFFSRVSFSLCLLEGWGGGGGLLFGGRGGLDAASAAAMALIVAMRGPLKSFWSDLLGGILNSSQ